MPPRPMLATQQEIKIFEWCDLLVVRHRDDCNKWLFAAIIDRAIKDYCNYAYTPNNTNDMVRAPHIIHQHASDWIFASDRVEFDLTFEEVCEPLGVNPEGIRNLLRQLTEGT